MELLSSERKKKINNGLIDIVRVPVYKSDAFGLSSSYMMPMMISAEFIKAVRMAVIADCKLFCMECKYCEKNEFERGNCKF